MRLLIGANAADRMMAASLSVKPRIFVSCFSLTSTTTSALGG
jgi:hypothetical protein